MGAAGYRDHVVVCGWNPTARDLIAELGSDEYSTRIVLVHDADKNPAGESVYFVNGDITNGDDLKRAGIEEAMAAVICPANATNEADMRSILCVMAIESIAPQVRTVVEVNNPAHVEHFERARADEILTVDELSARLRRDHSATLLAISRDGQSHVNPSTDFVLATGDDAVVVAESLGTLAPLKIDTDA